MRPSGAGRLKGSGADAEDTSMTAIFTRSFRARAFGPEGLLYVAMLPIVAAIVIVRRLVVAPVDPDYWWHLAAGRWILDHGRIPTTDPFSITHAGQSWYAHEWLAEVIMALADHIAGYAAVLALTAASAGVAVYLLWSAARCYGAGAGTAAGLVTAAISLSAAYYAARPQVWAFALFALLLYELAAHDRRNHKQLWLLPVLFAVWININLLALAGMVVLGVYAVHRALRWLTAAAAEAPEQRRAFWHTALVLFVSALALCLNPRGPELLSFAGVYINGLPLAYRYIQEWQPLPFAGFNILIYAAGAITLFVVVLTMAYRRTLWPGVLVVLFALASLRSVRYVPLLMLSSSVVLGWVYSRSIYGSGGVQLPRLNITRRETALLAASTCAVIVLAAFGTGATEFRRTPDPRPGNFPVASAGWIHTNMPDARLFNEYAWGGYLLDSFYPRRIVYIDGREEMYGEQLFGRYLQTLAAQPGWQDVLGSAHINAVLVDQKWPLVSALAADRNWRRVPSGDTAALFVAVDDAAGTNPISNNSAAARGEAWSSY